MVLFLCTIGNLLAQPANEIGCFKHFNPNSTGNNKTNAYLLSMLTHYVGPPALLNRNADDPRVVALYNNNAAFKTAFERKVKPWFNTSTIPKIPVKVTAPTKSKRPVTKLKPKSGVTFDFVYASDEQGIDPEAMIISTSTYIIVCWRGTDRVGNTNNSLMGDFYYRWGEWYKTNFNANLVPAQGGSRNAKVHNGMNTSVLVLLSRLAQKLNQYGVQNKKLWITGHSLGGASSVISAYYLKRLHNINTHTVYAYGSPHVGNQQFITEIDRQLPGGRLQRFDFMSDPTTQIPTAEMGYFRAGIRNWYSKESGKNYFYNRAESNEIPSPFLCLHHTNWYARAAYFEVIDGAPHLRNQLPNAPRKPTHLCSVIDNSIVSGSSNIIVSLFGGNEDLEEGDYYIINAAKPQKGYLSIPSNLTDQDGVSVSVRSYGNSAVGKKWRVRKVAGVLGGYTIQCKTGSKYLEADMSRLMPYTNNKVQIWNRLGIVVPRTHQEWYIQRLEDGTYRIKNIRDNKYLLDLKSSSSTTVLNKTATSAKDKKWFFVKVR